MSGTNEFIAQVLPLFLQFIGLPIVLGIAYYAYQNVYKKRQQSDEPTITSTTYPIEHDLPDRNPQPIFQSEALDLVEETEDKPMTEQNPTELPESPHKSTRLDTGDLPPLDMLLGSLEDDIETEPEPETPKQEEPPKVVQLREMSANVQHVQLQSGQIAPVREVITILRDEDDGKLIVQVGNTAYRTLADSPEIKRLFTQVMKELSTTITRADDHQPQRKRYVVGTPSAQPDQPAQKPTPSIRDLLTEEKPATTAPPAKPKVPPPPVIDGTMPGDLPSYKLEDNPLKTEKKGRFSQKTEAEPVPQLDLAAAIETYLQYKLQHTPEYLGRKIHIHGTPTGAIRIQVDDNYYDFVDEVADSEIRQFLQDTIAEWQDRQ